MPQPRWMTPVLVLAGFLVGCQTTAPSWASRPSVRSDDPLLCTDTERKRGADVYATTSQPRYQPPAAENPSR